MTFTFVVGDILHSPQSHAIAHCVAEDLMLNRGFAKIMKANFGGIDQLRSQKLRVGNVGVLKQFDRIILTMVTKRLSWELPLIEDFNVTLSQLRETCDELGITNLSCPLIGSGLDRIPQQHVLDEMKKVFDKSKIHVFIWRFKAGNDTPTLSMLAPNIMLAGDSNFLRVLNHKPGSRQGHVISGATILSIQYSLQRAPPTELLFFMGGTNDLLNFHKLKLSKRKCGQQVRVLLRRLMKSFQKLLLDVTVVTIPPCPLLEEKCAAFTVEDFNFLLVKCAKIYGFKVLDLYDELKEKVSEVINDVDKLHLTETGVNIIKNGIFKSYNCMDIS